MKRIGGRSIIELAYAMWVGTLTNKTSVRQRAAASRMLEEMGLLPTARYRLKYADVGARFTPRLEERTSRDDQP